jgi:hypothetical protein
VQTSTLAMKYIISVFWGLDNVSHFTKRIIIVKVEYCNSFGNFLPQVILQWFAVFRVTQLAQGLGFNLADALARYIEITTDFFQRMTLAIG